MPTRRAFLQSAVSLPSLLAADAFAQDSGTVPFANFEGAGWNDWTIEGDAFGSAPATDALFPGRIRGFGGRGSVCSLHPKKGNAARGKAVSREFTIEKPHIAFKIGGGNHPGTACLNLVVDGQTVRTATGDGAATLSDASWDVSALIGKKARLEIIDNTTSEQRGYIMVDDIQFGDGINARLQGQLENTVGEYLTRFKYPAIWAAISVRGKTVAVVASGLRKLNYSEKVTPTDKLMIGSTSKPVTGTLIGILIDKGVLKWETTVREALPELSKEFDRPWLDATVLQLLTHLSGCPLLPSKSRRGTEGDRISLRYQYVRDILADKEQGLPGEKYRYSSGHGVAVTMVERLTGKAFEQLSEEYLYKPLGIKFAGMGSPVTNDDDVAQPWGHVRFKDTGKVTIRRFTDNNPSLEYHPSGGIHMSITDLVKFGSWHATAGQSRPGICSRQGLEKMYIRLFNQCMANGFWVYGDSYGHNGLTGSHWTDLQICPNQIVIAAHTNMAEGVTTGDYKTPWPNLVVGPMIQDIRKFVR